MIVADPVLRRHGETKSARYKHSASLSQDPAFDNFAETEGSCSPTKGHSLINQTQTDH